MSPTKTVIFKLEPANASVPIDGNIMHDKGEKSDKNEKLESPKDRAPAPKDHVGCPYNEGKWTDEEHIKFLQGLIMYGKNWNKIQKYIITRTCPQTRSHAQKFFRKL
jgi:SHAQKYF class myb-like DNA-binding protein